MILSEQKRFIFIHIPKVGGTSIQRCLAPFYHKSGLERIPKRFRKSNAIIKKHSSAIDLKRVIRDGIWNSYFKFAFVRNPWDWVVSIYHYIKKYKKDPRRKVVLKMNFDEFVSWFLKQNKMKYPTLRGQNEYILYDRKWLVNFVGKIETFQDDFNIICKHIGINIRQLGKHNVVNRKNYRLYYNERTKKMITRHFSKDIKLFRYHF